MGVISAKIQVVFEGKNSPLKLGKYSEIYILIGEFFQ